MPRYNTVLFDLDGTLTFSHTGIIASIQYALRKAGITPPPESELISYIGPSLLDSFQNHLGLSLEEAQTVLLYYREYFADKGMLQNELVPGILDVLESLQREALRLFIATAKPEPYAKIIADHFGLSRYILQVFGASFDESRSAKSLVIAYALNETATAPNQCVMVGDHAQDVLGAQANKIDCIAVAYGYGAADELRAANPIYLAQSPQDALRFILAK